MKPGGSFNHFDIRVVGVQWFWHQSGGCFNHFDIRWNHGQPELAPPTELDSQSGLQPWSPAIAHSIKLHHKLYHKDHLIIQYIHMFDPTLHPTMFLPLQVLGDLQQCLSQPYPSKKSGVCLNHNNHVWPGKIRSSLFGVDNREPIRGMVLTCLYRSQDLSPLYLLLVQAPDFKSRWGRWCARKILFHESPPECQHTWA